MLDRISGPIMLALAIGLLAWGMPMLLMEMTRTDGGGAISEAVRLTFLATIFGSLLFALPLRLLQRLLSFRELTSALLVGFAWHLILATGFLYLDGKLNDLGKLSEQEFLLLGWMFVGVGAASCLFHYKTMAGNLQEA